MKKHPYSIAIVLVFLINYFGLASQLAQAAANQIAAGDLFTLALKSDGSLWAWGYNNDGQLGDGSTNAHPSAVKIGTGYSAVSAAGLHTLALKSNGSLWSWGWNGFGEVGNGSTGQRNTPQQIGTGYSAVAAGYYHSMALKSDNSLWSWGYNDYGQLGDGSTIAKSAPQQIGSGYSAIAAGQAHTLALKTDGSLWTWGDNSTGQLGDGTTTQRNSPQQIGVGFSGIAGGNSHSLALKADGTLWAWGNNSNGQLGDGTTTMRTTPVQIGTGYSAVAAGGNFSLALKADGTLWVWGDNSFGQLGSGDTTARSSAMLLGAGYSAIAAGGTFSTAQKADGSLWAWGDNVYGQVGDGTTSERHLPEQIPFGTSIVYNIPSPTNADQPFLRLYNTSQSSGQVRGTLYDQSGNVLGNPNSILIPSLSANAVGVLTAANIASAVGAPAWTGRAWMSVQADFAGLQALNLIRSSLLLSMSCLNSQYALYLPNSTSVEQPYVRLYNPSSTPGAVRGTLYDEGGNVLGSPNATLVASLAPNAVSALGASDIAQAFQIASWSGKAWMKLSSDFSGLKIMNTLRDMNANTLVNMSCDTGSTGTSANIYNIPPTTSIATTASIRLYNTSGTPSAVSGTLYAEDGSVLGQANAPLGNIPIPANGVMTLSQSDIAALVNAGSWTGHAWMKLNSSVTGLIALALTKQAINMEMSCVGNTGLVFNIPDVSNAQDQPVIRIYNTSSTIGNVYGTLYDQSGNVLGSPSALLVSNMPANSVTTLSATTLSSSVGVSSWTGRSWMQLSSTLPGLKVMDILQDVASGTWSNMSCATN